jgi:hypothetical protein
MITDVIAPRRANWHEWTYSYRTGARYVRRWQRDVRYGASRYMGSTIREEILKCFEQYVHLCSGLGEGLMIDVVRRYYSLHPERARGVYTIDRFGVPRTVPTEAIAAERLARRDSPKTR